MTGTGDILSRNTYRLVWLFATLFWLLTLPPLVILPSAGLDASWQLSLGLVIQQHFLFGQRFLWTYGPLGFLHIPMYYPTHKLWFLAVLMTLLARSGLWCVFLYSVQFFAPKAHRGALLLGTLVVYIAGQGFGIGYDLLLIGTLLLVLSHYERDSRRIYLFLFLSGLAFAGENLIKSTGPLVSLSDLILYTVLYIMRRRERSRQLLVLWGSYILSFIVLWITAGQTLQTLLKFILGTLQMIKGYTSAMSIPGSEIQTLAAIFVLVSLIGYLVYRRNGYLITGLLLFSPLVFEVWKEGFVRHDPGLIGGHAVIFFSVMLAVTGLLVIWTIFDPGENRKGLVVILCPAIVCLFFTILGNFYQYQISLASETNNVVQTFTLITSAKARNSLQHQVNEEIRSSYNVPKSIVKSLVDKTTNILPWDIAIALGYHLQWDPSPVPQTYSVYTPYLDGLNAKQLHSSSAAQRILFSLEDIDGRYPIFSEPKTFRALLEDYRPIQSSSSYLVLSRKMNPTPMSLQCCLGIQRDYRFGQHIPIPSSSKLVFADISIHESWLGFLVSTLFKPSPITVSFELRGGKTVGPFRFLPAIGQDGLFVTEYIPDLQQLINLYNSKLNKRDLISSIVFNTATPIEYSTIVIKDVAWKNPLESEAALF